VQALQSRAEQLSHLNGRKLDHRLCWGYHVIAIQPVRGLADCYLATSCNIRIMRTQLPLLHVGLFTELFLGNALIKSVTILMLTKSLPSAYFHCIYFHVAGIKIQLFTERRSLFLFLLSYTFLSQYSRLTHIRYSSVDIDVNLNRISYNVFFSLCNTVFHFITL
jgi:hypothetical protein